MTHITDGCDGHHELPSPPPQEIRSPLTLKRTASLMIINASTITSEVFFYFQPATRKCLQGEQPRSSPVMRGIPHALKSGKELRSDVGQTCLFEQSLPAIHETFQSGTPTLPVSALQGSDRQERSSLNGRPSPFGSGFNQKYRYYSGIYSMVEDGPDENS